VCNAPKSHTLLQSVPARRAHARVRVAVAQVTRVAVPNKARHSVFGWFYHDGALY